MIGLQLQEATTKWAASFGKEGFFYVSDILQHIRVCDMLHNF